MKSTMKPHEIESRLMGKPNLGAGKIFTSPIKDIVEKHWFEPPKSWLFGISLDHGWNHPAAACSWAKDPTTGIVYCLAVWRASETPIPTIASVLRQWGGEWKPIFADPSGQASRQELEGRSMFDLYADEGIELIPANNSVDAGIEDVRHGLLKGTLKILATDDEGNGPCAALIEEYDLYRRDEKGKIVKRDDDAIDAFRYGFVHRDEFAPDPGQKKKRARRRSGTNSLRQL